MAETIRTSRSYARPWLLRGIGGFLAALAAISPAAADQPSLSLEELVLTAHRSIDQHEIAFLALVCGVVLFAVVTAIMLVRTRVRAARAQLRTSRIAVTTANRTTPQTTARNVISC